MFQDSWTLYDDEPIRPKKWIFHPRKRSMMGPLLSISAALLVLYAAFSQLQLTQPPDNLIVQDGQAPEGDLISLRKILAAVTPRVEPRSRWKKFSKGVRANGFAACLTFLAAFAAFLLSPFVPMDSVREAVATAKAEWTPAPFLHNDLPARQASWSDETNAESASTRAYYPNCAAARAAGAAPIHIGEPGYAPWLDADGDGVACEPYRPRWRQ